MKIIDVIVMISQPEDSGNIVLVNASASEGAQTPVVGEIFAIQLGMALNEGYDIISTKPIGDEKVQYTLLRRRHVCDPCSCDNDEKPHPWK